MSYVRLFFGSMVGCGSAQSREGKLGSGSAVCCWVCLPENHHAQILAENAIESVGQSGPTPWFSIIGTVLEDEDMGHRCCPNPHCRQWIGHQDTHCDACGWRECRICLKWFEAKPMAFICQTCKSAIAVDPDNKARQRMPSLLPATRPTAVRRSIVHSQIVSACCSMSSGILPPSSDRAAPLGPSVKHRRPILQQHTLGPTELSFWQSSTLSVHPCFHLGWLDPHEQ